MTKRLFAIAVVLAMVFALAPMAFAGDDPPPVGALTDEPPPAEDPPAEDPPAEDPPAEDPPPEDPPAEPPPGEDPPADPPPEEDPPAEDPPAEDPPAEDPPAEDPAPAPQLTFDSTAVVENSAVNTVVGTLELLDGDPEATYAFVLVAGDGDVHNGLFKVVDGTVVTAAPLDYEILGGELSIRVGALDAGTEEVVVESAFAITLTDAGDIVLDSATVAENVPIGTVVGAFAVSSGDDAGIAYSLTTGGGHRHNHLFAIEDGVLVTAGSLDFELLGGSLSVRVAGTDTAGTVLFENSVTIALTDVADIVVDPDNVDENVPIGTVVGQVSIVGDDGGSAYAYQLTPGFGDRNNNAFAIVQGELVTAAEMDFETMGASLSIRVKAIDRGTGEAVYANAINIGINDLDDEDPEIDAVEQVIIDALRPTCDPYGDDFVLLRFPQLDPGSSFSYSFGNDRDGGERRHQGADIFGEKHSPVVAVAEGTVVRYGTGNRAGHYVVVEHEGGWETLYIHLNNDTVGTDDGALALTEALAPGISPGAEVEAGQILGWVGDSGNAEGTSAHTHFELWDNDHLADPHACLDQAWRWQQRVREWGDTIL